MKKFFLFLIFICILSSSLLSQSFDNNTRAIYILDISKYVQWDYPEFATLPDFTIGVLSNETDFYMELANVTKTRDNVHSKRIKLVHFRDIEKVTPTQVLFVYDKESFKIKDINKAIEGNHTLLITENFEFQKSMINFLVVENKPKFEANEARMTEESLKVSQLFLAQAIKTREDWEDLYKVTDEALDQEKIITAQQKVVITEQEEEIKRQQEKLKNLNLEIEKKIKDLNEKTALLARRQAEINAKNLEIASKSKELEDKSTLITEKEKILSEKEKTISKKNKMMAQQDSKIASQNTRISQQLKAIEKQRLLLYFCVVVLALFIFLGYFIYRAYKIKKEANIKLEEKNRVISKQKDEITKERDTVKSQRDQIAYQKQHIMDSIAYAKRIQTAIIPSIEFFSDQIDHFVLYKPRDIVSGDFYWNCVIDDKLIVVAADCTGHGVPGAFMSMLGVSLLNEIVLSKGITQPNEILNELREEVINALSQRDSDVKDGMDITICQVDKKKNKLLFAGANNPLYLYRNKELIEVKGDKMPVAIYIRMDPFKLHEIDLQKGDTFYIFSDGYIDQFGGPKGKKFLTKNFKLMLGEIQDMKMVDQGKKLNDVFEEWKKDMSQIDDVCVIGVRY